MALSLNAGALVDELASPSSEIPSAEEIIAELDRISGDVYLELRINLLRAARQRYPKRRDFGFRLLKDLRSLKTPPDCLPLARELAEEPLGTEDDCVSLSQTLADGLENAAAASVLERAVALHSESVTLWHNFGVNLYSLKRLPEALRAFRRAIELCPFSETSLTMAGSVLRELGQLTESFEFHGAAIRVNPKSCLALYNLGNALQEQGSVEDAITAYTQALAIRPDWPELLNNLCSALFRKARFESALPLLLRLAKLRHNSPEDLARVAVALRELNRPSEALEIVEILIREFPENSSYRSLKGSCLTPMGRSEEAALEYKKIINLDPDNLAAYKSLAYVANYLPYEDPQELFAFYRKFGELAEGPLGGERCLPQRTAPFPRKLRIGYASGDFCQHPIYTFIKAVLAHHDQSAFEVYCYYNYARTDWATQILQAQPVHWRNVESLTDKAFCDLVRGDKIDILIDLSGHTSRNRLSAFALKPAPVQVTMIGCMQTTGLTTIDYRITDDILDPPGQTEGIHTEKLLRLESGPLCFEPYPAAPEPGPVPSLAGVPFTFGSFNNLAKATPRVLDAWSKVLRAAPHTRMQVVSDSEEMFLRDMEKRGIPRSRFIILPRMDEAEYLAAHASVDLILDTFPYCGLTVTMHALWMGVPNVTMTGNTSASRAGASILKRLSLPEFVTENVEEYIRVAVRYANKPSGLTEIRNSLREKMREVWANGAKYTLELEGLFRKIWQTYSGEIPRAPEPLAQAIEPALSPREPEMLAALSGDQTPVPEVASKDDLFKVLSEIAEAIDPTELLRAALATLNDSEGRSPLEIEEQNLVKNKAPWKLIALCAELYAASGARADAERCFNRIDQSPATSEEWAWLARSFSRAEFPEKAETAFYSACEFSDVKADATLSLAYVLAKNGKNDAAELFCRRTISLSPSVWAAYLNLGNLLYQKGDFYGALRVTEPATRISDDFKLLLNLAVYQQKCGHFSASLETLEKVITKDPTSPSAYVNLGNGFLFLGLSAEASAAYKKAQDLDPSDVNAHSNYLQCQTYLPDLSPEAVFASHRRFSQLFEAPLLPHKPHANSKDPKRRLRIGYVSPDFRTHSVAYFIEPLLTHHDRTNFEVVGIQSHTWRDQKTDSIQSLCDQWIDAGSMSDESLAECIRAEGIDIAVDLICHSQGMRLLSFARKPAPVQITMIGMQQTTGLESMDYRVTDAMMDPPGTSERFHSETLMRLPLAFSFQPPDASPPVAALPALEKGMITFGSFNNFAKIHIGVLRTWAEVLRQVPNSRFFIVAPEGTILEQTMAEEGIAPERIIICPRKSGDAYLHVHDELDLMLDSFPFGGLTISAIAAWMGVPTLTVCGDSPASRAGTSLMHSMGLDECIASDPADFVKKAVALASDLPRLASMRASMRERMAKQVTDGAAYTRSFEQELRKAWERWCESK